MVFKVEKNSVGLDPGCLIGVVVAKPDYRIELFRWDFAVDCLSTDGCRQSVVGWHFETADLVAREPEKESFAALGWE